MTSSARFDDAMADVSKAYAHPREVMSAADLSVPQKVELLRQWELDLRENLVATEENMAATRSEGDSAELLRAVRQALADLGATERKTSAPARTGGA